MGKQVMGSQPPFPRTPKIKVGTMVLDGEIEICWINFNLEVERS